MAAVDFNALRARAMGSGADEEAVTVNTRALIDKVLARYSGEWTVLRELLQNAADACATTVSVKFETLPSTSVPAPSATDPTSSIKHVIAHHTVKRLLLTNNGIPFTSNDWSRLKRIAEGNPDETKIGAFGVGFYSVFSDCEEPFVSSGNEAMAFYWKGNALFTRRLQMGEADSSPNTNFVLDYRSTTSPVPALLPLCQFLASSLTFAGLETVELWLDNWNLLTLSKKVAPSVKVSIPRDIETQTAEGMMKVASVNREVAQMDATCMSAVHYKPRSTSSRYESIRNNDTTASLRSFFSRLTTSSNENSVAKSNKTEKPKENGATEDLTAATKSSVFLHITTGHIRTSVSQSFSRELERATKKPPPKTTTLAILTSSHEAYSGQNDACRDGKPDILASVLPSKSGRIFIGFPTHQTTGLNAHVSAPSIIPTVERESIDLNARWVRSWNVELLRAVGVICRIAWSAEMASLNDRIILKTERPGKSSVPQEILASFLPEAIHTSNQFVFRESTPTAQVGGAVEDSFWTCSKNAFIDILSTCGVLPSHRIRIAPKDLSFMDKIPVLPEALMSGAKDFVDRLIYLGLVTDITVSDIKNELESHALTSGQLDEFLAWISRRASSNEIDSATVQSLLGAAVANDERPDGSTQRVLVLADIKSYVNPSRVPADFPIPPFVMPFRYTKHLSQWQLASLGWHELGVDVWIQWLLQNSKNRDILSAEHDMTETPSFSAQVLPILSKHLDSLAPTSRAAVVNILQSHTIMPTKAGMKRPSETYFPSVKLFDDLPVVTGLNNVKEKFLMSLGVRKTVELSVIFERLLNPSHQTTDDKVTERRKWSHVDLIKYLASVRNDIPSADIEKLKKARFCSAESDQKSGSGVRYKVSELFEPNDSLRGLELPLLYWPTRYMPTSPEAKFLNHLGLRKFPSASELIELMACAPVNQDFGLRDKAMSYFVTEHVANGYGSLDSSKVTTPYLPIEGSTTLSTPNKCFTDSGSTMFGFNVLRKDLHVHASKFGVKQHPPLGDCIGILTRQPPASGKQATIIFSYFAGRLGEFNEAIKDRIARASIVPISSNLSSANNFPQEKAPRVRHVPPQECYIGESEEYGDLFEFVDFGQEANLFLLACGSKRQPTKIEVASLLVKEPAKISSKLRDPEKYLNLLRAIAESMSLIKRHKDLFRDMKRAPFLLASKELPPSKSNAEKLVDADDPDYEEDDRGIKEWQLVRATDAIVVDDFSSFSLFKHAILAAPQEELLEDMYMALGTPGLNSLVEEQARIGPRLQNSNLATRVQKRISERSRLFLHDMSREYIRRDTRWLEQNLSVQVVQTLSLRRSLKGRNVSHTEKRNAVVTQSQRDWVLSIGSGPPDYYQISQMLVHVILSRPKLHSTLTLEMLLKTDLMELKARGYNVDRILKQKAAEARMAETRRQQQLEEERKQMQDVEMQSRNDEGQVSKPQNEQLSMPGVFPDSTGTNKKAADNDHVPELPSSGEQRGFGGLFSNFTRRFEEYTRGNSQIQSTLQTLRDGTNTDPGPEGPPPPPYTVDDPQHQQHGKPHQVTSLHNLQSNLHSAVKACRPHGSSTVYNQGEKEQVVETKSYCDERPGHDLECIGHSDSRLRVFLTKSVKDRSSFLKDNMAGINAFATVLAHCASVFDVHIDSVNIFHETGGKTIAFNSRGSIFCNYLYFQQLHEANVLQGDQKAKKDTLVYWWVIFCHELAHNLVSTHSAEHSYYTEGFVAQYFANLSEKLVQYAAALAPAASVR